MNKNLGPKIIKLRKNGKTYNEIINILNCSKSTVCYHCGIGQKAKFTKRQHKHRSQQHPYVKKRENFLSYLYTKPKTKNPSSTTKHLIKLKLELFCSTRLGGNRRMYNKPTFTLQDIIDKFGENPKCYLTGEPINIYKPRTYNFDHIIPVSRGGENTLENLGICTKKANSCKSDMTPDELLSLCKQIIEHYGKNKN